MPNLTETFSDLWSRLERAADDARSPWHLPVLGTVDQDGPHLRTVVLRAVDPERRVLRCHTDARSPKCAQVAERGRVAWLFYDSNERIQLRCRGTARVRISETRVEAIWEHDSPRSRRCYLAPHTPGTPIAEDQANLPKEFVGRDPNRTESERGRANFAIIECVVDEFNWLRLHHDGHVRARFRWSDGRWQAAWIAA